MKLTLLYLIFLLSTSCVFGQAIDSLGKDDDPLLNSSEAAYFNEAFRRWKNYDLNGKRVAFVTGSSCGSFVTKSYFFSKLKVPQQLAVLNEKQRLESGYDAIICSWCKLSVHSATPKLLKRIRQGQIKNARQ